MPTRPARLVRRLRPMALLALSILLVACGGVPGGATDSPTGVVRTALDRMAAKQIESLPELACAAQRDRIAEEFDLTGGIGGMLPGMDTQAFLDAVSFDISGIQLEERSVQGDAAEVGVTGTLGIDFDAGKLREVLEPVLAEQGMPTDDATIDAMLGSLESVAQNLPIDETIQVVREGGEWRICDATFMG